MKLETRARLRTGLFGLMAAVLVSCSTGPTDGLDFPLGGDDTKSDTFGRSLVGVASPYEPNLSPYPLDIYII